MSNRCKPEGASNSRPGESIPDNPADMACVPAPGTRVTKVTAIRVVWTNAHDKTAQARSNGQFLHNRQGFLCRPCRASGGAAADPAPRAVIQGG